MDIILRFKFKINYLCVQVKSDEVFIPYNSFLSAVPWIFIDFSNSILDMFMTLLKYENKFKIMCQDCEVSFVRFIKNE